MFIAALIFAALSAGVLGVAIWSLYWPRVKGTIDVSIFDLEWGTDLTEDGPMVQRRGRFYLAYSYNAMGRDFQGSRIAPLFEMDWQFSGSSELGNAKGKAQWYREGLKVDVYYCPLFPSWACLEPGGFILGISLGIIAAILFFNR